MKLMLSLCGILLLATCKEKVGMLGTEQGYEQDLGVTHSWWAPGRAELLGIDAQDACRFTERKQQGNWIRPGVPICRSTHLTPSGGR